MKWASLLSLLCLFACHSDAKPEREPAKPSIEERYRAAIERLFSHFYADGYIFSRAADGSRQHVGEAILWSGVAMTALPCDKAQVISTDLVNLLNETNGEIRRYEPLTPEYNGRELNFDGETGLIAGFSSFVTRCPELAQPVKEAWVLHQAAIERNGGELYPGTGIKIIEPFLWTTKALSAAAGMPVELDQRDREHLEDWSAGWALSLHVKHSACYRAHLAFLHLQASEALGHPISKSGRDNWCAATRGMDIPTIDFWCGRSEISAYIDSFQQDQWEYRFQRCGSWELPDGAPFETPGLDLIVAIKAGFDL